MNTKSRTLSQKELDIIKNLDLSSVNNKAIHLLYLTGSRRGELRNIALKWELDNKPTDRVEYVPLKKRGKQSFRTLNLNTNICSLLEDLLQEIKVSNAQRFTSLDEGFRKHIQRLGLAAKDFRTDFGSNVHMNSKDAILTRDVMGHTSVKTTELYIKYSNIKEAIGTIEERTNLLYNEGSHFEDWRAKYHLKNQECEMLKKELELLKAEKRKNISQISKNCDIIYL
jgi:integrase